MRREKIIVSLIIMMILFLVCGMSVFATDSGTQPLTTIKSGNSSSNATSIKPINATTNNNGTTLSGGNSSTITPITSPNNSNNGVNSSSSTYTTRNNTNNTNTESSSGLPYTGVSYNVIFIIIALVISAVYAYKKVSDYNM